MRTRFGDAVVHDGVSLDVRERRDLRPRRRQRLREVHAAARADPAAAPAVRLDPRVRARGGGARRRAALPLRRNWGVMFERGALFSSLTVSENVGLPLREHTQARRPADRRDRRREDRAGGPAGERRGEVPGGALGRHAQARGARARDRARSGAALPRRADRRARPAQRRRLRRAREAPEGARSASRSSW